jgi:hypothetical protein
MIFSKQSLLLFLVVQPISNFLGGQEGVASGMVVDDEVDLDFFIFGPVYDSCWILVHRRTQHAGNILSDRKAFA